MPRRRPSHHGNRVPRPLSGRAWALLLAAPVVALLLWPAWTLAQTRLAVTRSPLARDVAVACEQVVGSSLVYHVKLVGRGALCSALVHQDTFWSSQTGNQVPAHWARFDCVMITPHSPALCSVHTLFTVGDWGALAGPPAPEVTTLLTSRSR